jgi:hypothetical protein
MEIMGIEEGNTYRHRWGVMSDTPPYVGYVNYGKPTRVTYTEEVEGSAHINHAASKDHSSPLPPTFYPHPWGFFVNNTFMCGLMGCSGSPGVKSG